MELQYCREFVVLVQTRNYSEAAERLYMSQSTLSRHIQALEKDLGQKLFSRSTRNVELTEFGLEYYKYAYKAAALEEEFNRRMNHSAIRAENEFNLNLCYLASNFGIPKILRILRGKHPEIQINTSLADTSGSFTGCLDGTVDFFICREYEDEVYDQFERIQLFHDQIMLVMSRDHLLAKKETITASDVQYEQLITTSLSYGPYRRFSTACYRSGFEPVPQYINPDLPWVLDMVSLNKGVTVLAESLYRSFPSYYYLTALPFKKPLHISIGLFYRKGREVNQYLRTVLDTFQEEAKTILLPHSIPSEQ